MSNEKSWDNYIKELKEYDRDENDEISIKTDKILVEKIEKVIKDSLLESKKGNQLNCNKLKVFLDIYNTLTERQKKFFSSELYSQLKYLYSKALDLNKVSVKSRKEGKNKFYGIKNINR